MHHDRSELKAPGTRRQLVDWLVLLASQSTAEGAAAAGDIRLPDDFLDFLDDSGVADRPGDFVGDVFFDDEVELTRQLGEVVERVIDGAQVSWRDVVECAGALLRRMRSDGR